MITKNLKIEKIGRKWLECKDENKRIYKVEINENVKIFLAENDKEIFVCGDFENKSSKFGIDRRIVNVISKEEYSKIEKAEAEQKEIEKKQRIIKSATSAIEKMLFYIEKSINEKNYWYKNGENVVLDRISELQELKVDITDYETRLTDLKNRYSELKNTEAKSTFTDRKYYEVSSIVKYNNKYIKILSYKLKKLTRNEVECMFGGCFADNDEDYYEYRNAYEYAYIDATEEEISQFEKEEQEKNAKAEDKKEKIETMRKAETTLLDYIYSNCTQEEKSDELETNISNSTEITKIDDIKRINSNKNLNVIYLLIKNWSDYDNWDYNNCRVGICKTCVMTDELNLLIDEYQKACEAVKC